MFPRTRDPVASSSESHSDFFRCRERAKPNLGYNYGYKLKITPIR
jgi:hypothetical protein